MSMFSLWNGLKWFALLLPIKMCFTDASGRDIG